MTTRSIVLGEVIQLAGRSIVLIQDELGNDAPSEADSIGVAKRDQYGKHLPIWVSEPTLLDARRDHPGVPVYGIFQLLISSGAVNASKILPRKHGYLISLTDEEDGDSLVLVSNGERLAVTHTIFSTGSLGPLELEEGALQRLVVDWDRIKIGASPIRPPAEVAKMAAQASARKNLMVSLSLLAALGSGFLLHLKLAQVNKVRTAQIEALGAQATDIRAQAAVLRASADTRDPTAGARTWVAVTRLAELSLLAASPASSVTPLNAEMIVTLQSVNPALVTFPIALGTDQTGAMRLRFSLDGSQDSTYVRGTVQ